MTTFEQDGYNDGVNGVPCSVPCHPETDVFKQEYRRGYDAGLAALCAMPPAFDAYDPA